MKSYFKLVNRCAIFLSEFKVNSILIKTGFHIILLIFLSILFLHSCNVDKKETSKTEGADKMQWWRDAKFGMFIHWGLYSQCEGYWRGEPIPGIGEWIFKVGKIPVEEYKDLAKTFSAEHYNPEEWVKLAKQAGMKYIVITTKHHDGFALFKSEAHPFNVVDTTPYGKDVIGEFVKACNKHGMRIGFYYSQYQDWSYPGAGGNDWEPGYGYSKEGFQNYMEKKGLPQVREILSNYGTIDMIWFDTPGNMTREESETFLNLSKKLQPNIIVSGRIGNDVGDYVQMGDNNLPKKRQDFEWEVPVTMNHTWAYKKDDQNWKPTKYLLWQLIYITSMGGNYLLNIGPKADGTVPQASIDRLKVIGEWMRLNGEAIEGADSSPYINQFEWGSITRKPGKLYLNIVDWPEESLSFYGLKNKVNKAYLLETRTDLPIVREGDYLIIDTPDDPVNPYVNVVVLEIEGEPEVKDELVQERDGRVLLETELAVNTTRKEIKMGAPLMWVKPEGKLKWTYKITSPGKFNLQVITTGRKRMATPEEPALWDGGHKVLIKLDDREIFGIVDKDKVEDAPRDLYNDFKIAEMGKVEIAETGLHTLELIPKIIVKENNAGLAVRMVRLIPID